MTTIIVGFSKTTDSKWTGMDVGTRFLILLSFDNGLRVTIRLKGADWKRLVRFVSRLRWERRSPARLPVINLLANFGFYSEPKWRIPKNQRMKFAEAIIMYPGGRLDLRWEPYRQFRRTCLAAQRQYIALRRQPSGIGKTREVTLARNGDRCLRFGLLQ